MTKVELVNKYCMCGAKIPRKNFLFKSGSLLAHWVGEGPEC